MLRYCGRTEPEEPRYPGSPDGDCVLPGQPGGALKDNGSEFAGKVMDRWTYERNIEIDFSRPGKPTDNKTPAGVSDRKLVLVTGRRPGENRTVEDVL